MTDVEGGENTPMIDPQGRRGSYAAVDGQAKGKSFTGTDFESFANSSRLTRLCIYAVIVYLFVGVFSYSVLFEKWSIVDSLYFSVVSFSTVGYGDITPETNAAKIFTIFFVLVGIAMLGVALGIMGEILMNAQEELDKQMKQQGNAEFLSLFGNDNENVVEDAGAAKKEEKSLMRRLFELLIGTLPLLTIMILVSLIMGNVEGWDYVSAFYYCVITATTVGYGDVYPETSSMKLLAVIFIPVSVGFMGELLGRVGGVYLEHQQANQEKKFLERQLTLADLEIMDANDDGDVSMLEFFEFMLVAMQKVDKNDLDDLRKVFNKLDADGSGTLQKVDLELAMAKKKN
eukprot:CAMPEP_0195517050 /NCGR_PEP_ID=MMETSP0794_2-20130614/9536_1 /TAXON_ID=515487 /ORGANISM="Stephanopyxis turris, Strain CCMP 815" /LENGTH=343 /DNA_ID=CAMNT_0040645793 /DNA_START=42 /DNA_END=1073 /DNA_ORIENTATION=-